MMLLMVLRFVQLVIKKQNTTNLAHFSAKKYISPTYFDYEICVALQTLQYNDKNCKTVSRVVYSSYRYFLCLSNQLDSQLKTV